MNKSSRNESRYQVVQWKHFLAELIDRVIEWQIVLAGNGAWREDDFHLLSEEDRKIVETGDRLIQQINAYRLKSDASKEDDIYKSIFLYIDEMMNIYRRMSESKRSKFDGLFSELAGVRSEVIELETHLIKLSLEKFEDSL